MRLGQQQQKEEERKGTEVVLSKKEGDDGESLQGGYGPMHRKGGWKRVEQIRKRGGWLCWRTPVEHTVKEHPWIPHLGKRKKSLGKG